MLRVLSLRAGPSLWLVAPAIGILVAFLLVPYLNIIVMSFRAPSETTPYGEGFSVASYQRFFTEAYYIETMVNTLWIGVVTTAVCFLLAFPVAWQLARTRSRLRGLMYGIVLSPLLVGIVVRSFGWTILLGNAGVINRALRDWGLTDGPVGLMYNELGIIIALAHVFLPFMILPIMGALQNIEPALENAARSLGAGRTTVFFRVIFPLAMPGIQAGVILVFVLALSAYVTPLLIGGMRIRTMPVVVVDTLIDAFQWPFGSALALILSVAGALCVFIFARITAPKWR